MSSQRLAKDLEKTIIRKFERWKVYSSFEGNNWGADLENVHLISNIIWELYMCYSYL